MNPVKCLPQTVSDEELGEVFFTRCIYMLQDAMSFMLPTLQMLVSLDSFKVTV